MDHHLLSLILLLLFSAVLVVPLFQRAGLGAVLGYLLIGSLLGPSGLSLLYDAPSMMRFAELGVVFLLFVIGLELKPSRLWAMRNQVFGFGALQVFATTAILALGGRALGVGWTESILAGVMLSLSSTALSLQVLSERNQLNTNFGRTAFAVLLFQDLAAIPLLTIVPLLSPDNPGAAFDWKKALFQFAILGVAVGAGRYLLRPWLRFAASARIREVFLAAALLVVLGAAVLMESVGLSMALGTFLAGILLSDSEFRHELETDLEPFKGLLLGLFFMAVGMSIDYGDLLSRPVFVFSLTAGWMFIKFAVIYVMARFSKQHGAAASSLAQVLCMGGEFAFVVLGVVEKLHVIDPKSAQTLTLSVALSMVASPILYFIRDQWTVRVSSKGAKKFDTLPTEQPQVILAGFGRVGQIVGRILRIYEIPYTALELDPDQVQMVRRFGAETYYGDASRLDLLEIAGAKNAKLFILAVDDVESSLRVARMVKEKFPGLRIIARARNRTHAFELYNLGIEDVFRETLGTSFEMAETTLVALGFETTKAANIIQTFRKHDEKTLQEQRAHLGDEKHLIKLSRQSVEQLADLLRKDKRET
jgi:monovalent cation:proton antiporter-2 (CPA2) family protein